MCGEDDQMVRLTLTGIDILMRQGESTTLEFKESLSVPFARELVALANTMGGRILLGVSDDGVVKSIKDTKALRARIQDIARNYDPPVKVLAKRVGDVLRWRCGRATPSPCNAATGSSGDRVR